MQEKSCFRVAFIDWKDWEYDVTYPLQHPMGGSESAMCYLASEMAARGHEIVIFNGVKKTYQSNRVKMIPKSLLNKLLIEDYFIQNVFDAVIVITGPADTNNLRSGFPSHTKLFLWTGHATDQPDIVALHSSQINRQWDGIIAVSNWQKQSFIDAFKIDPERIHVLRNAISPVFESLFPDKESLGKTKIAPWRFAYTSTPFRGLDFLLVLYKIFNDHVPNTELEIYSSLDVYKGLALANAPYAHLYEIAKNMQNVRYFGAINQASLAQAMKHVSILSYSNTFAETSCICVMEAMAAGAYVVTSDYGALAETTAGFATLIPLHNDEDRARYCNDYVLALKKVIDLLTYKKEAFIERQFEQIKYANSELTWKKRADEWEEFLTKIRLQSSPSEASYGIQRMTML